ncbi:UNVERIFIED_CONTAM: hypothetical protein K2H54_056342 [Gekko kuhli]
MGNILNKLHIWYEKLVKFRFPQDEADTLPPIDVDFHIEKIRRYGDILRNTMLPIDDRAKAAHYIGLLAYTGGVTSSMPASEYIQDMTDMLIMADTPKRESGGEMLENRLESLSGMEWFGWPMNYAEVMLSLLGFQNVQLD